jgi:hypothetical protein
MDKFILALYTISIGAEICSKCADQDKEPKESKVKEWCKLIEVNFSPIVKNGKFICA